MSRRRDQDSGPGGNGADVPAEVVEAYTRLHGKDLQGPPDLVDQAVLNRARAAVAKPHSSRPWSFGWPHALSTLAVIVLGLTVLLQLREQAPTPVPSTSAPSSAVPFSPAPTAESVPAKAAAAPPEQRLKRETETTQSPGDDRARAADAIDAGPLLDSETRPGDSAARQGNLAERENALTESIDDSAMERSEDLKAVSASRAPELTKSRQEGSSTGDELQEPDQGMALQENPQIWLAEIRRLKEAGLTEQFTEELALFRTHWPDVPIPADLEP